MTSFNIALAEDENNEITESIEFTGEVEALTLEEAINELLEDNANLEQLALAVEGQEAAYREYMSPIYDKRGVVKNERKEGTTNYYELTVMPEIKEELMVEKAKRTLATTKEALKAGVEEAYFGILQAKENVRIHEESLALKEELLEQTKQKFELGMVAKNAILKAETDYLQAETDLREAVDQLKSAKMSLNVLLGNEVLENIQLTDTLEPMTFEKININEGINSALEKRAEVINAYYTFREAEVSFEVLSGKYTPNTYKYKQADANRKVQEESYEKTIQDIKKDVLTKYMAVLTNKEAIDVLEKQVSLAEEVLRIQKLSFELGQNTLTDVQSAENDYKLAQLGLSRKILDYNLSVLAFKDAISIGR
jgi:outer membrane protein TolC